MQRKTFLLSSVALATAFSALPAFAQESEAQRETAVDRVLQKVTVSATKKKDVENVQDVPIAVTAFNANTLDALNVSTLEDLSYSAPNVSLDDVGTSRGTANFAIRGLGVNSSIPSIDPAVGVFIDGVYLGVNSGVVVDLFDLDSVEVLRGPQGLLFGRNTTGGALVLNTGNPTDEFTYKARARFDGPVDGDRGGLNSTVQGIVSGPLVEGVLNGKIGAYYNSDAGYFKNLADGDNHGEAQTAIYRGALEWFASERLTFLLKGQYNDARNDGPSGQNRAIYERDSFDFAIDNPGSGESETTFASLRTDYDVDFGNGQITNIVGYRKYESLTDSDIDASPANLFHSGAEFNQEQISNELRYAGTFGNMDLTTGLYYFEQDLEYTEIRDLLSDVSNPPLFYGGGSQEHTVYGAFANVDYSITPDLIATVGLRYSKEEKDVGVTYIRPRPECYISEGTCPTDGINPFTGEPNGFTDGDDWSNWTPKLGLQYFWSDNFQTYGSYTKGFRSGGYNFRITNVPTFLDLVNTTGNFGFDEEEVDAYEIGFKSGSEDGRIQLNGAAFLTEIGDMQREVNTSGPEAAVVQNITNTADATIMGVEVDGRWAATDNLLLNFNIGMIDAEYDDVQFDISTDGVIDDKDLKLDLPRVPQLTYGFGAIYDLDLGDSGALVTTANYQFRDRIAYTDSNFGWVQASNQLSADLTWETPYEGFAVSLFGDNLLDEVQVGNDTQLPFPGPNSIGVGVPYGANPQAGTFSPLNKGRVVGVEFTIAR